MPSTIAAVYAATQINMAFQKFRRMTASIYQTMASESVAGRRLLGLIDDEHLDLLLLGFQFQTQLLLDSGENGRSRRRITPRHRTLGNPVQRERVESFQLRLVLDRMLQVRG